MNKYEINALNFIRDAIDAEGWDFARIDALDDDEMREFEDSYGFGPRSLKAVRAMIANFRNEPGYEGA